MKNRVKLDPDGLVFQTSKSGIKKKELAVLLGISRETYSRWLSGKIEYVAEEKLLLLAKVFKCSPNALSKELKVAEGKSLTSGSNGSISGDSLIEMGWIGGYWQQVEIMASSAAGNVEQFQTNFLLFKAIQSFLNLDHESIRGLKKQSEESKNNYDLFDTIARHHLMEGLALLLEGELDRAVDSLRNTVIQGKSVWMILFAYLCLACIELIQDEYDQANDTVEQGITIAGNGQNDLETLMITNLYLLKAYIAFRSSSHLFKVYYKKAVTFMELMSYQDGVPRQFAYRALLAAKEEDEVEALYNLRRAESTISKAQDLHKLEVLFLGIETMKRLNAHVSIQNHLGQLRELAKGSRLFESLVEKLELKHSA